MPKKDHRSAGRRLALTVGTACIALAGGAITYADNVVSDGDNLAPFADSNLAMGEICVGEETTRDVAVFVTRQGGYNSPNVFKKSTNVTVSVLSATGPAGSGFGAGFGTSPNVIAIPATWDTAANGTHSPRVTAKVRVTPTAVGAGTGTVSFRGTGTESDGTELTRDDSMSVSWTAKSCAPVDTTAPTPSASASTQNGTADPADDAPYAFGDWSPKDVTVALSGTDNDGGSGVASIRYTTDGTTPSATAGTVYGGAFLVSAPGTTTVKFVVIDAAGNVSPVATRTVKVDKADPAVAIAKDPASEWAKGTVTLTVTASDALSGLQSGSLACKDGTEALALGTDGKATVSGQGTHSITCTAKDAAGNTGTASEAVKIDTTAPAITITKDPTSEWANGDVTVTVGATDTGGSGRSGAATCKDGTAALPLDTDGKATISSEGTHSITCTAKDVAGNTGTASETVKIDATDPAVTITEDPASEWTNGDVTITVAASDAGSGLSGAVACKDGTEALALGTDGKATVSGQGTHPITCTAKDAAGNTGTGSEAVKIDTTDPAVTITKDPASEWTNGNVTITVAASDALSGLAAGSLACKDGTEPLTLDADGKATFTGESTHPITCTAKDVAGNEGTASETVKIDTTGPAITAAGTRATSGAYSSGSWTNETVTVTFTCSDTLSGLATGACPAAVVQSTGTPAAGVPVSGSVSDRAGNSATSDTITVKVDKTAPTVAVTGVENGKQYVAGSVPAAGCTTSDALSGVKTHATPTSTGGPLGEVTVTCGGARDEAGNAGSATAKYTVVYAFEGFFQPIDGKDASGNYVLNSVKAGSTVPVKFRLGGDQGMKIFWTDAGQTTSQYPNSAKIACGTAASDAVEETSTATVSGLKYDATAGQYVYNWKTDGAWAGTCRQLIVRFADGTYQRANFRLMK